MFCDICRQPFAPPDLGVEVIKRVDVTGFGQESREYAEGLVWIHESGDPHDTERYRRVK